MVHPPPICKRRRVLACVLLALAVFAVCTRRPRRAVACLLLALAVAASPALAGEHAAWVIRDVTVEPGKRADLVLLRRNPAQDVHATRDVLWVMKGGELYDPGKLLASQ